MKIGQCEGTDRGRGTDGWFKPPQKNMIARMKIYEMLQSKSYIARYANEHSNSRRIHTEMHTRKHTHTHTQTLA